MLCLTCVIINVKRRVEKGAVSVLNEGRSGGIQREEFMNVLKARRHMY